MKKLFFAVMAMVALMTPVEAQQVKVRGTVKDARTGEALPLVNVGLMRTTDTVFVRGAASDFNGVFEIGDVKPGDYLLQASCVGYESYLKDLKVVSDLKDLTITLKGGTLLETVEISAEKPLYVMDGEKNMYNTKEDPSIQTGTASDALQNAPGVEVDAEGNITLRGVSSVEIWINDRPSHMNEEALKQYIKQMPANAIERIEVITNPSARYSTSGGVINIVTNQRITRNELLCVGAYGNTMPGLSPWVSYVWANEKVDFNFYLNGRWSQHNMGSEGKSTLYDTTTGAVSRYQEYSTDSKNPNLGGYMGFNFNWNIDSMTHLSAWMGAYPGWGRSCSSEDYIYREYLPTIRDLSYADTTKDRNFWGGGYAGAWFEHRFDTAGRKLSVNFNGNLWGSRNRSDQWRRYLMATARNFDRQSATDYFGPSGSLGVNYTQPLNHNIEIETGAEVSLSYNTNDQRLDSLLPSGEYDNMNYRSFSAEGLGTGLAAYVTAQKRWGGLTAKVGLRFEDDIVHGGIGHKGMNDRETLDTAFFGFVPSIHLSYQTKNFESYSLSYTRRFSHSEDIANYETFCRYAEYSYSTGNPHLLMSYTHNVEAAFNKYLMGFGNIGLNAYFRANSDEVGTMTYSGYAPAYFPATQLVNYTMPVNIGSSHTEGIEANVTYRPSGFFNVRLNASLYNYTYDYNGVVDGKVSWSTRVNVWAKLWGWLEVFANAHYTSPRLSLYSVSVANKGVDFGLSSDFFDRKLSLFVNVNDIFGMAEWGSNTTAPSYKTEGSTHFDSRFLSLGLTWRIGKMELESKARQGATDSTPQM
ncbi:MAG: outer membrane beta-barrel protein [bacterium]